MISFEKKIEIDKAGRKTERDMICLQVMDACLILNLYDEVYLKQNIPSDYLKIFNDAKEIMDSLHSEKEKNEYSYICNEFEISIETSYLNFKRLIERMVNEGKLLTRESLFDIEEDELKELVKTEKIIDIKTPLEDLKVDNHKRKQYLFALKMKQLLRIRKYKIYLYNNSKNKKEKGKMLDQLIEERINFYNFGVKYLLEEEIIDSKKIHSENIVEYQKVFKPRKNVKEGTN